MTRSRTFEPGDEELLELLGAALTPTMRAPSADELHGVKALVALHCSRARPDPGRRTSAAGWRRRMSLVGAALGVVVLGTGTAFAAGAPVPEPLRALAVDVGLPVTPVAVVRLHDATNDLRSDLRPGSTASVTQTERDTDALGTALDELGQSDRATEASEPQHLLDEACQYLAAQSVVTILPAACGQTPSAPSSGPSLAPVQPETAPSNPSSEAPDASPNAPQAAGTDASGTSTGPVIAASATTTASQAPAADSGTAPSVQSTTTIVPAQEDDVTPAGTSPVSD